MKCYSKKSNKCFNIKYSLTLQKLGTQLILKMPSWGMIRQTKQTQNEYFLQNGDDIVEYYTEISRQF